MILATNYKLPKKNGVIYGSSSNYMIITLVPTFEEGKKGQSIKFKYTKAKDIPEVINTTPVGVYSLEEIQKVRQDFITHFNNLRKYPKMTEKDWE